MIRKVNTSGVISTFAGTGLSNYSGDGGPATSAGLSAPRSVTFDALGNIYIADYSNCVIRKVNSLGIISTFAGTGTCGYSGDGGTAINAKINGPRGIAIDAAGNLYFSELLNNCRVREICIGACPLNINSLTKNNILLMYPNPNNGSFKLQIENEIENGELILLNSLGQKVHEQKIIKGDNNINTHNLASGLYNCVVLQNKEQISNGKLAVE